MNNKILEQKLKKVKQMTEELKKKYEYLEEDKFTRLETREKLLKKTTLRKNNVNNLNDSQMKNLWWNNTKKILRLKEEKRFFDVTILGHTERYNSIFGESTLKEKLKRKYKIKNLTNQFIIEPASELK